VQRPLARSWPASSARRHHTGQGGQLCGSFAQPSSFLHFWWLSDFRASPCYSVYLALKYGPNWHCTTSDTACTQTLRLFIVFADPLGFTFSFTSLLPELIASGDLSSALTSSSQSLELPQNRSPNVFTTSLRPRLCLAIRLADIHALEVQWLHMGRTT